MPDVSDEPAARLYQHLLAAWNRRSARDFAALFVADGSVVGFDGSPMNGAQEIEVSLAQIFANHATAAYVGKIRAIRPLGPGVLLVQAVCGMIPPGQADINPAVNAMQALAAVERPGGWRIAHFQNTPAQFHGRPELAAALTEELRELVKAR
jgi:uncharacterized protein (TIGR02246 family)